MRIKTIGKFQDKDDLGYLVIPNMSAKNHIEFKGVLNAIVNTYRHYLGKDLFAVYVRGSLVRNKFIRYFSDVDTFALLQTPNIAWVEPAWRHHESDIITKLYPFIMDIDFKLNSYDENFSNSYPHLSAIVKTQSICIYGFDIATFLPPL